jgi:glutamate racemase
MADDRAAIGIFDSGVGGLTVFRQVAARLPGESIVYLGDTARVPYGTKSADTVVRYARACARILLKRNVKLLVVACNTASAFAVDVLRDELDVPVVDVVGPGARAAVARSRSGRIGVIGTAGTVASRAYDESIAALQPGATVTAQACPLFVPLAEEGWLEGTVPEAVAHHYLDSMRGTVDTLVLGCTHYPLLAAAIGAVMGPEVALVDSAEETARVTAETLAAIGAANAEAPPCYRFLVSDAPDAFVRVGQRFLGRPLAGVEWVDF